jgi:hypothetical protein
VEGDVERICETYWPMNTIQQSTVIRVLLESHSRGISFLDTNEKQNKKIMSLSEPWVRRIFLARVFSVVPPQYREIIDPSIVDKFVDIISLERKHPFPIDADDIVKWMGFRDWTDILRILKKSNNDVQRFIFEEGRDYVIIDLPTKRRNQRRRKLLLSIIGFEQLCAIQRNPIATGIMQYFFAVERLYRDHAERIIYERSKSETSEELISEGIVDTYDKEMGELAYLDKITQKDPITGKTKIWFHPGHTRDEVARNQNLKQEYGKNHQMIKKAYMQGSPAIEEEFKRLAQKWKVDCGSSPRKEETFYSKDLPAEAIWETSIEAQLFADRRLKEKLATRKGHDALLESIPIDEQSNQEDNFTFGTRHGCLKTVKNGQTIGIVPKRFVEFEW